MAPLTDPVLLEAYKHALANWRFEGYVLWSRVAAEWVRGELEGYSLRAVGREMHDFVVIQRGQIDQVAETRPEWNEHEFHYDLRFEIQGRAVYVETRLLFDDPSDADDPQIHVVNIHDQ